MTLCVSTGIQIVFIFVFLLFVFTFAIILVLMIHLPELLSFALPFIQVTVAGGEA